MPRSWVAWTTQEYAIVDATYPESGSTGAIAALIQAGYTRTPAQVKAAAHRRGLRCHKGYVKFQGNPMIDRAIISAYQRRHRGEKGAIKACAQRWGVTYGWLRWRALHLGVVKPMAARMWSAEEESILAETIDMGLKFAQARLRAAGYQRSQSAILEHKWVLDIQAEHPDLLTAAGVARMLGVEGKTVGRWIRGHGLNARKRRLQTPADVDGDPQNWAIHRADLAKFLRDHPTLWDLRRVNDHFWVLELLAGPPSLG